MAKISPLGSYKFRRVFSIVALADVNDGGSPYMGISPGRIRPWRACINQSKIKCAPRQHASSGCTDARDSLGKNVSKEVCFGCEGKITLFSFPKNTVLRKQWMRFVFPGQQRSFSSVC